MVISISDHYSQFLSVERQKVDFKNVTMYHQDYLNFNTQAFCDDISIQKWNNNLSNVNDQFRFRFRLSFLKSKVYKIYKYTIQFYLVKKKKKIYIYIYIYI